MWTTRDGYRLRLRHAGLHRILSRLRPEQLRPLTGDAPGADPAPRLVRTLSDLTARARRVGALRTPSGERLPVFAAPGYRMLVHSRGGPTGEILLVRPAGEEGEEEASASQGLWRTLTWGGPVPLSRLSLPSGMRPADGGIYIVEIRKSLAGSRGTARFKDWAPIYVGKADTFLSRLGTRREVLRQMGLPLGRYQIWLGKAQAARDLHAMEHAVVRAIINYAYPPDPKRLRERSAFQAGTAGRPIPPLTNLTPKEPFRLSGGPMRIVHSGSPPPYLGSETAAGKGTWFEFPDERRER